MAFREYINDTTGESHYCFEGEEEGKLPGVGKRYAWWILYKKTPPNPTVIQSTSEYMAEDPVLDSLKSIYELDRQLNIEAETDRELKELEQARANI